MVTKKEWKEFDKRIQFHEQRLRSPKCEHCGASKTTHAGLCPKCCRFGTPRDNQQLTEDMK